MDWFNTQVKEKNFTVHKGNHWHTKERRKEWRRKKNKKRKNRWKNLQKPFTQLYTQPSSRSSVLCQLVYQHFPSVCRGCILYLKILGHFKVDLSQPKASSSEYNDFLQSQCSILQDLSCNFLCLALAHLFLLLLSSFFQRSFDSLTVFFLSFHSRLGEKPAKKFFNAGGWEGRCLLEENALKKILCLFCLFLLGFCCAVIGWKNTHEEKLTN